MKFRFQTLLMGAALLCHTGAAFAQEPPKPTQDTFAADIKPGALWDGRKLVPFRSMDFPKMVKVAEVDFLDDEDYVLGFTLNGESRAYPLRYLWWHHIINDKMGRKEDSTEAFVTVTY